MRATYAWLVFFSLLSKGSLSLSQEKQKVLALFDVDKSPSDYSLFLEDVEALGFLVEQKTVTDADLHLRNWDDFIYDKLIIISSGNKREYLHCQSNRCIEVLTYLVILIWFCMATDCGIGTDNPSSSFAPATKVSIAAAHTSNTFCWRWHDAYYDKPIVISSKWWESTYLWY